MYIQAATELPILTLGLTVRSSDASAMEAWSQLLLPCMLGFTSYSSLVLASLFATLLLFLLGLLAQQILDRGPLGLVVSVPLFTSRHYWETRLELKGKLRVQLS